MGPAWVRRVRQRLPGAFVQELDAELQRHKDRSGTPAEPELHSVHFLLIQHSPGERDAAAYLDWLAGTGVGELYECLAPHWPAGETLPRELGAMRDRHLALLRLWNEHYFSHVDPAILSGLQDVARRLEAEIPSADPVELAERTTNGLVLGGAAPPHLVLVPQHHMVPFNSMAKGHERLMILYPADVDGAPPDAPPASLRRLARALADESRLRILRQLSTDEPRSLTEIARAARLAQSTIHHHLLLLRVAGLVRVHLGDGHANQYTLRPHAIEELGTRLRAYLAPPAGTTRPAKTTHVAKATGTKRATRKRK